MAKYTYDTLMSELKSGVYRPVYYLMGEEGYFTDRITGYIMDNALTEVERDFNLTVYYGLELAAALALGVIAATAFAKLLNKFLSAMHTKRGERT